MPWLPDDTVHGDSSAHKTVLKEQPASISEPSPPPSRADGVTYIPTQMDPLAGASVRAAQQDPIRLIIADTAVLLRLLLYVPNIFAPFFTRDKDAELYPSVANAKVVFLQVLLALLQVLFLVTAIPAYVSLPGGVFLAATALGCLTCYLLSWPMQGPPIIFSNMDDTTKAQAEQHRDERWVFVNGICTG